MFMYVQARAYEYTRVCVSVGQSLTSSVSPSCSFRQSLFTKSDYPGGPASPRCPPDPAFQALGFKPATLHLFFFFFKVAGDPNSGPSVCVVSTSLSHLLSPSWIILIPTRDGFISSRSQPYPCGFLPAQEQPVHLCPRLCYRFLKDVAMSFILFSSLGWKVEGQLLVTFCILTRSKIPSPPEADGLINNYQARVRVFLRDSSGAPCLSRRCSLSLHDFLLKVFPNFPSSPGQFFFSAPLFFDPAYIKVIFLTVP